MKKDDTSQQRLSALFSIMSEELSGKDPYCPAKDFAVQRLKERMRKRAASPNDSTLSSKACSDFSEINRRVGEHVYALPSDLEQNARHFLAVVIERFTLGLDDSAIQYGVDLNSLLDRWKYGPGASNGVRGTHAAEKVTQSMTSTLRCKPLVVILRERNTYFQRFDTLNGNDGTSPVSGSRLTTVPKNEEAHRTIAIEPSGNMALQLAAGSYLEGVLRSIGLDIRSQQPKNKAMAKRGSVSGGLATIDLKSASDMFGTDLVRALMPVEWYWLLITIRSPSITYPDGHEETLNMMSTMGNGFTFPLMTLLLVSLIYALRCRHKGPTVFVDWSDTCVFGDDIIVPVKEYDELCLVLEQAGLVVNHSKSYREGPFRESCGGDYYEGWDVTPFYVRHLDTEAAIYVAINQVFSWCARQVIILPRTLLYLKSLLRGKVHLVPEWMNPDQGLLTQRVPKRYTYLSPVVKRERLSDESAFFSMMLVSGGYLSEVNSNLSYSPRQFKTKAIVRKARLPNGYLDGSYPLFRTVQESRYVDIFVEFFFSFESRTTNILALPAAVTPFGLDDEQRAMMMSDPEWVEET